MTTVRELFDVPEWVHHSYAVQHFRARVVRLRPMISL
jgi:hypothetical protein